MDKTCTCEGVEDAAKKAYENMIEAGSPKFLAEETSYEILNGEWVECKCEASKGDE